MFKYCFTVGLGAGLAIATSSCDHAVPLPNTPTSATAPDEPQGDIIQAKSRPYIRHKNGGHCDGKVTAIGPDWFEVTEPDKPARRILTDGTIPGGDGKGIGQYRTYRLVDLQIGDIVRVMVSLDGKDEVSSSILIMRRPGGKIPPYPREPMPGFSMIHLEHLEFQAYQDWEEQGIPIPKEHLDRHGRATWTNPPYPPVAPQPREVVRP